jgi:hypothetical protein
MGCERRHVRAPLARCEALDSSLNTCVDEVLLHGGGFVLIEVRGDGEQYGVCAVQDYGEGCDGRVVCSTPLHTRAGVIGWRVLRLDC